MRNERKERGLMDGEDRDEQARAIGQRVRNARLQAALTQEEAAKWAGLSAVSWVKIENGHSIPRPNTVRKIAKVLKCDPGYLRTGKLVWDPTSNLSDLERSISSEKVRLKEEQSSERRRPPSILLSRAPAHMSTSELLAELDDLVTKHRSFRQKAMRRPPESSQRNELEQSAQATFERITKVFMELQDRPDGAMEIRGIEHHEPEASGTPEEGVDR